MDFFYHQLYLQYFVKCHFSLNHSHPLTSELLLGASFIAHLCSEHPYKLLFTKQDHWFLFLRSWMATAVNMVLWRVFSAARKTKNKIIILTQAGKCLIYHDRNLHVISVFFFFHPLFRLFKRSACIKKNLYVLVLNIRKSHSNLNPMALASVAQLHHPVT